MIALTAMVICSLVTAQAADTTATLACKGTETWKTGDVRTSSTEINAGITVNFQKRTITGLNPSVPFHIDDGPTETIISFAGVSADGSWGGVLDRVTGHSLWF
jgi:hypothetical protein